MGIFKTITIIIAIIVALTMLYRITRNDRPLWETFIIVLFCVLYILANIY